MSINIISVYNSIDGYLEEAEKEDLIGFPELWEKYAIKPYWDVIAQWAPFDLSDRKPKPITDTISLRRQLNMLKTIDLGAIESEFQSVVSILPGYDSDALTVAIYPLDDRNQIVKERQNGVQGDCIFGNIVLQVNPFAEDYLTWIPYVFAHEYHHCIWGHYRYVIRGGGTGTLLEALLIDGQADSFAKCIYPSLHPAWISQISEDDERKLWRRHYSGMLKLTEFDYPKYMFGNREEGIPWCAGYFFGYRIIESFRKQYPHMNYKQMLEMDTDEIFTLSRYQQD